MSLDYIDRTLLQLLQTDNTLSLDELARRTGSTKTPIWNRIKKLKQQGVIQREVALCDPDALGLTACFFVLIQTSEHDADWPTSSSVEYFTSSIESRAVTLKILTSAIRR